jgi:hypothetical protein
LDQNCFRISLMPEEGPSWAIVGWVGFSVNGRLVETVKKFLRTGMPPRGVEKKITEKKR